jgi:phosphohistidine phosphatase
MKTLYLLRHAKASRDDSFQPDINRPLTERGNEDARIMSGALKRRGMIPDKIVCSTAERAVRTASIFADTFSKNSSEIDQYSGLYDSFENDYLDVISKLDDKVSSCLLAAHNETISLVAGRLLQNNIDPMKTCEVVVIKTPVNSWKEFCETTGSMQLRLSPSDLK